MEQAVVPVATPQHGTRRPERPSPTQSVPGVLRRGPVRTLVTRATTQHFPTEQRRSRAEEEAGAQRWQREARCSLATAVHRGTEPEERLAVAGNPVRRESGSLLPLGSLATVDRQSGEEVGAEGF